MNFNVYMKALKFLQQNRKAEMEAIMKEKLLYMFFN